MSRRDPLPVRATLALLRPFLPRDWRDDILADLRESHRRRADDRSRTWAALWLVGQAGAFAAHFAAERLVESVRGHGAGGSLDALRRDLRESLRAMASAPGLTLTVVGTVAVAVGATTAIASVVQTVLLAPLPYPEPERIVVMGDYPWTPTPLVERLDVPGGPLAEVAGFYPDRHTLVGAGEPVEVEGVEVTHDFFDLLGVEMATGRGFDRSDMHPDAPPVVILSHALRQRRFAGEEALGHTVRVDGRPREVVGVTPAGFRQLTPRTDAPELWLPARPDPTRHNGPDEWIIPVARLAPESDLAAAQSALDRAAEGWRAEDPGGSTRQPRWAPLSTTLTADAEPALLVLLAAVTALLLLACVNVSNLLLVRAAARRTEVAVRSALGASRGRLLRRSLTESVVLGVAGGLGGLAVLAVALEVVLALAPPELPRLDAVKVDVGVLLFALTLSVGTGLLFGITPALAAARQESGRALGEGGRAATGSGHRRRLTRGLVVTQVALTVLLLVGAGLLLRSFAGLSGQEPGFRTHDIVAVSLRARSDDYASVPRLEAFQRRVGRSLAALPGVEAVGATNNLPMRRSGSSRLFVVEGEEVEREAQYGVVSPGYFEALEIPLLQGRSIRETDTRDAPAVAVVDEPLARRLWPGGDALGRRFRLVDEEAWITVVGVSAPVRGGGPGSEPAPGFYISWQQRPANETELAVGREVFYLLRTPLEPSALAPAVRRAVADVDPVQPVAEVRRLADVMAAELAPHRFRALLLAVFAGLALALAASGTYGVMGQVVAERTREMGIRRALGASPGRVALRVLGLGMRLTLVGAAVGLAAALLAGPWLESLLFGVEPADPLTALAAVATVVVATAAACLAPALRAGRLDPVRAIRTEA